jgi:thiol:disulfide interchange protein DsbC
MREFRLLSATVAIVILGLVPLSARSESAEPEPNGGAQPAPSTAHLQRRVRGAQIEPPEPTPVAGIFRARVGSDYVYLTADGRHAFVGDLLDLSTGENLTDARRNGDRLDALAGYPAGDLVLFPAEGTEKARVRVFTDSTCPYCRKLHAAVPDLQKAGVTVAYIPFPRGGEKSPGYKALRAVWCAEDRRKAMDIATGHAVGQAGTTDCVAAAAVDAGYRLGVEIGISGTPTIVLPTGAAVPGYVSAGALLTRLGLENTSGTP